MSTNFDLGLAFFWAQDLMIGMSILMSSFVVLLVLEISTRSKKQQMISGLNAFVYWFSAFIYDYCVYLIPCILVLVILSIFETECLSGVDELGSLAFVLILHGISALLFIYCCTYCSESAAATYSGVFLYYFLGLCLLGAVYRFEYNKNFHVSEPLNIIFSAFMPSYCAGRGIYNIYRNCISNYICNNDLTEEICLNKNVTSIVASSCCSDICGDSCILWDSNYLSLSIPGIGKQLIALAIQPFVFFMILIVLEMGFFQNLKLLIKERKMKYFPDTGFHPDKTVDEEAENILTTPLSQLVYNNNYLVVKNVSKFYSQYVVRKLSFTVQTGKCLGLIGVNEAGKSTVLKMISGGSPLSSGNIYIDGLNVLKYPHKVQDKVGFTFGNNALLKHLTVEETLTLYACIRGIPENEIQHFIDSLASILSLNCDALIKDCNNSVKRKLNVAIAIIGTPPLILLDDPTSEMDPIACMNTTEAVKQALNVGCTVVLTTRRIDECEAVCNRIGILVNGRLTYIGDLNYLKRQYEDGFTLILRIQKTRQTRSRHTRGAITVQGNLEEIKGVIEDAVPQAVLKVEYSSYLNYYIPKKEVKWSKLFSLLEKLKSYELIFNYTICETNLDQIFSYHVSDSDHLKDKKITEFLRERKLSKI